MKRFISICILCLVALALFAQQTKKLTVKVSPKPICDFYVEAVNPENSEDKVNYGNSDVRIVDQPLDIPIGWKVHLSARDMDYFLWYGLWRFTDVRATQGYTTFTDTDGIGQSSASTDFTMPSEDLTVTFFFEFNPDSPQNPSTNGWYPDDGLLVMDDFQPGYFFNTFKQVIPEDEKDLVQHVIAIGDFQGVNHTLSSMASNFPNCVRLDLGRAARVMYDYRGEESYQWNWTSPNAPWEQLVLPADVTYMRDKQFENVPLEELTIYATTPPRLMGPDVFSETARQTMRVFVPEEALPLYQAADGWKEMNLLPIIENGASITVRIMESDNLSDLIPYHGMTIEVGNTKSGLTRRMLVSSRNQYVFASLPKGVAYSIRLLNAVGQVVGQADNVYLEENTTVTFGQLRKPHTIAVKFTNPYNEDKPLAHTTTWLDADGKMLGHNDILVGVLEGETVSAALHITDESFRSRVHVRDTVTITVGSDETVDYKLRFLPTHNLKLITRADNNAHFTGLGAKVVFSRLIDGSYEQTEERNITSNTAPDDGYNRFVEQDFNSLPEGDYQLQLRWPGYMTKTVEVSLKADQTVTETLSRIVAKSSIHLNVQYVPNVEEGETPVAGRLSGIDYNVGVRDLTDNSTITSMDFSNGVISFFDEIPEGHEVEVTFASARNYFAPIVMRGTMPADGQPLKLDGTVTTYGSVQLSITTTECARVGYKVFNEQGALVSLASSWDNNQAKTDGNFSYLPDGRYTVVAMELDDFMFPAMTTLAMLQATLTNGLDYASRTVDIVAGLLQHIDLGTVPRLRETSQLYTDGNTTYVSPKKPQIVAGQYQTLSTKIGLKPEYKDHVQQMTLVYDLPANCTFIESSPLMNSKKSSYTFTNGHLEIPLLDAANLVRFCVVPTAEGEMSIPAQLRMVIDGQEVTQPLPCTPFAVEGATIIVPRHTARADVMVRGQALPNLDVTLYANDEEAAIIKADAAGDWKATVQLADSTNMSTNRIYAKFTTAEGITIRTDEKSVTIDRNCVRPVKVTMSYWNAYMHQTYNIVWDYANRRMEPGSYPVYHEADCTFLIELTTADTTKVSGLDFYVFTSDGGMESLPVKFNKELQCWVATQKYGSSALPTNIHVEVFGITPKVIGGYRITNDVNWFKQHCEDDKAKNQQLDALSAAIDQAANALSASGGEAEAKAYMEALYEYMKEAGIGADAFTEAYSRNIGKPGFDPEHPDAANPYHPGYRPGSYTDDDAGFQQWLKDMEAAGKAIDDIIAKYKMNTSEWELAYKNFNELGDYMDGLNLSPVPQNERQAAFARRASSDSDTDPLVADGYELVQREEGTPFYLKQTDNGYVFIDIDDDVMMTVDYSKMQDAELSRALDVIRRSAQGPRKADLNDLKAAIQTCKEKIEEGMNKILDACQFVSEWAENLTGSYESQRIECEEAICTVWDRTDDCIRRGWAGVPKGQEYLAANKVKIDNLERKIEKIKSIQKTLEKFRIGKLIGSVFAFKSLWDDYKEFMKEADVYIQAYNMIPDPCPDDQASANSIRTGVVIQAVPRLTHKAGNVVADATQCASALVGLASGVGTGPVGPAVGIGAAIGIAILKWGANKAADCLFETMQERMNKAISQLKCYDPDRRRPRPDKDFDDGAPILDPSGYVYEAVASNRVEGATATVYYREWDEDMYGDLHERVVLWDAEKYAQENPLFTDENGQYAWDVPVGDWMVRISKDGYETVQTEWLPVPPPQLDVNIALSQYAAPSVRQVKATEQGVQVTFDKYMRPELLDTAHVFLTKNGQKVEGRIELLNREQAPDAIFAYASRLRFIPTQSLADGEQVMLTVKKGVESYARVQMESDYTQEFDVEKRVRQLVADSAYNLALGQQRTITIAAVPADAAVGRKVSVSSMASNIAQVGSSELTFDQNGEAQFSVSALLFGTTALRLQMQDDDEVEQLVMIGVKDSLAMMTRAPEASRLSGTEVYCGTKIRLTSQTTGATIWYTLDGSCPCDMKPESVMRYEGPIEITGDVTIKAIAVAPDYTESTVATFTYKVRRATAAYDLAKGWNWVSHNQAAELDASELLTDTDDYAVDEAYQPTATLEPAKAYRVYSNHQQNIVLTGYAWNVTQGTLQLSSDWNWTGFPMNQVMTPDEALAFAQPTEGDIIMGRDGFNEYVDGQWQGTLRTLVPGKGYRYKAAKASMLFLNNTIESTADTISMVPPTVWNPRTADYPDMMAVTAILKDGDTDITGDDYVIGALTDDYVQSLGESQTVGGRYMMNIAGDARQWELIRLVACHKPTMTFYDLNERLYFEAGSRGTRQSPYILTMGGECQAVNAATVNACPDAYTLEGIKLSDGATLRKGVYVRGGRKVVVR